MIKSGLERQKEIYLKGFAGMRSKIPVDWFKLEQQAKSVMSPEAFAYIAGAAGLESTMASNRSSFEKYKIVPRVLRNVEKRDTSITLFGQKLPAPILLSPVGVLQIVHKEADVAVGKAAAQLGLPYIFSNQASKPMEEVSAEMGDSPRWMQLYWSKSNELVESFAKRAEKCGCSALVITLDTTLLGWRTRDLDIAYLPFLEGKGIAQYTSDLVFQRLMDEQTNQQKRQITIQLISGLIQMSKNYPGGFFSNLFSSRPVKAVQKFIDNYSNPALTWDDLKFLRDKTKLPILLKGIVHADDARMAIDHGMDGIIVSNHGGRQVDGAISSLEALPEIVEVVQNRVPVLMDSGIRGGADVFKALALGAKAVCVGRPYVYGLTVDGQRGMEEAMGNLIADFDLTMGLAGCSTIKEITKDFLTQ